MSFILSFDVLLFEIVLPDYGLYIVILTEEFYPKSSSLFLRKNPWGYHGHHYEKRKCQSYVSTYI